MRGSERVFIHCLRTSSRDTLSSVSLFWPLLTPTFEAWVDEGDLIRGIVSSMRRMRWQRQDLQPRSLCWLVITPTFQTRVDGSELQSSNHFIGTTHVVAATRPPAWLAVLFSSHTDLLGLSGLKRTQIEHSLRGCDSCGGSLGSLIYKVMILYAVIDTSNYTGSHGFGPRLEAGRTVSTAGNGRSREGEIEPLPNFGSIGEHEVHQIIARRKRYVQLVRRK